MDLRRISLLLITLFYNALTTKAVTLQATINSGGIKGTVTFSDVAYNRIKLSIDVIPNNVAYFIKLHERRVNFDTREWCSDTNIGTLFSLGTIPATSGKGEVVIEGVQLSGTHNIEGRSVVVQQQSDASILGCGNIEATDVDYVTAVATFKKSIGGQVTFRQQVGRSEAAIQTDLYYLTNTDNPSTEDLDWHIHRGPARASTSEDMCGGVGGLYNPTSSSGTGCSSDDHEACKMGDLSGKHGKVTIGKTFHHDNFISVQGLNSINGTSLVIMNGTQIVACSNILLHKPRTAISHFSSSGVKGSVAFKQISPNDPVNIHVNLQNLRQLAGGYHVHIWPVPKKVKAEDDVCSGSSVAGHFNPFGKAYPVPTPSETLDRYEVGDLSGKFGSLEGKEIINVTYTDYNLQLFGRNSVVGRSVVIHKNDGSASRWVCSNIELENVEMVTGIAKFVYPVYGSITFRQPKDDPFADTQIFVQLNYNDGKHTATTGHNWHLHLNEAGMDFDSTSERCKMSGDHYNPYDVDLQGNYGSLCKTGHVAIRCESGDLSGKHGKLGVRNSAGGFQKMFATDVNIAMSGPQSIIGRSVVIHEANSGAGRLACATVHSIPMRMVTVNAWTSADRTGNVAGSISFSSDSTCTVFGMSSAVVSLSELDNTAAGYHVHEFPTGHPANGACSGTDVGGHFNPFGVNKSKSPSTSSINSTDDMFEVGDLSGKHGDLVGSSITYRTFTDMNLPLRGHNSIVGRSVVIHKNDASGTRWACGNIEEDTGITGGTKVVAKAEFEGDIVGSIVLTQYIYQGGGKSDTGVMINLTYKNDATKTTGGHNWHVHEHRIEPRNCIAAQGHFDPFHAKYGDAANTYNECSMENPLRCEVGDQSGKLGTYTIGAGKKFFTDVNLPLIGLFGVLGRSFVIHAANNGADRIACADLVPDETDLYVLMAFKRPDALNLTDLSVTVADAIGQDEHYYNIIAKQLTTAGKINVNCVLAKVYFVGEKAKEHHRVFASVYKSNNHGMLKHYQKDPVCKSISGAGAVALSFGLLLACLFLVWS